MIAPPFDLAAVLSRYRQARDLKPASIEQLTISCRLLARWYGMPPPIASLDCQTLDRFLQEGRGRGLAAKTLNRRRGDLLTLVRFAHETWPDRVPNPPLKLVKFREPRRAPEAWTLVEGRQILDAAANYRSLPGFPSCRWPALMLVLYDTAFRIRAALAIKTADWRGDMLLARAEHQKTATDEWRQLHADTIGALKATFPPDRPLLFGWPYGMTAFWRHWRAIVASAGLPTGRRNGPQRWRRMSASYLEAVCPGAAMQHLGHRTPGLAQRTYIDPRIAGGLKAAQFLPRP